MFPSLRLKNRISRPPLWLRRTTFFAFAGIVGSGVASEPGAGLLELALSCCFSFRLTFCFRHDYGLRFLAFFAARDFILPGVGAAGTVEPGAAAPGRAAPGVKAS